jgi:hypothetical protein
MAAGRPRLQLCEEQVVILASLGCINEEIAELLRCSADTLTRNYQENLDEGRAKMKMSLRRKQVQQALAGNTTMLIWLGKQYLGQRDKTEVSGDEAAPLGIRYYLPDGTEKESMQAKDKN